MTTSSSLASFSNSTRGRADQQASCDSNRVWDALFCVALPNWRKHPLSSQECKFPIRIFVAKIAKGYTLPSAIGSGGEPLYPRKWNHEFMDLLGILGAADSDLQQF